MLKGFVSLGVVLETHNKRFARKLLKGKMGFVYRDKRLTITSQVTARRLYIYGQGFDAHIFFTVLIDVKTVKEALKLLDENPLDFKRSSEKRYKRWISSEHHWVNKTPV